MFPPSLENLRHLAIISLTLNLALYPQVLIRAWYTLFWHALIVIEMPNHWLKSPPMNCVYQALS